MRREQRRARVARRALRARIATAAAAIGPRRDDTAVSTATGRRCRRVVAAPAIGSGERRDQDRERNEEASRAHVTTLSTEDASYRGTQIPAGRTSRADARSGAPVTWGKRVAQGGTRYCAAADPIFRGSLAAKSRRPPERFSQATICTAGRIGGPAFGCSPRAFNPSTTSLARSAS